MDKIISIYKILSKALYNSLKCFLVYVIVMRIIFEKEFNKNMVLICSFALITLLYICVEIFDKKFKDETSELLVNKKYFHIVSVVMSLILCIICSYKTENSNYVISFLYFMIIDYTVANKMHQNSPLLEFCQTFFLAMVTIVLFYEDKQIILGNTLLELSILLFVFCLIYMLITSLCYQYEQFISINKKKNIIIINSIFMVVLGILVFLKEQTTHLFIVAFSKTESFFTYVLIYLVRLFNLIFGTLFTPTEEKENVGQTVSSKTEQAKTFLEDESGKEMLEKVKDISNIVNMEYVYIAIFAIFALIILVVIFFKLKSYRKRKASNKAYETKEFIFTGKDIFNLFKNNVKQIFQPREKLSRIRLRYKATVEDLISSGYEFYPPNTPNEYNDNLDNSIGTKKGLPSITEEYNRDRYGKKN